GAHTAHLREPYLDGPPPGKPCTHPHPTGTPIWSDAEVDRLFGTAHAAGVQVHAHAIGDAAIDQGLEAFSRLAAWEDLEGRGWLHEEAASAGPPKAGPEDPGGRGGRRPLSGDAEKPPSEAGTVSASAVSPLRHRFEHYEIVHDAQIARTVELGLVASSQPNFVGAWSSKGGLYEGRLGPRFRLNNRFRTFKGAGLPLAFGSDGMPFGPLVGIQAAVAHPDPEQRLTPEEAVWHYTRAAAWAIHWEDGIGSLEASKRADILVLRQRSLGEAPPVSWRLQETLTGGVTRFKETFPALPVKFDRQPRG
ncbi:MAG TPA: amidohydrolase family protein, partial [Candidatus Thermoplasmatota archaeon]|nr:amidohydrolase family protein [Candidatus Thermoplasmatota archaeon]